VHDLIGVSDEGHYDPKLRFFQYAEKTKNLIGVSDERLLELLRPTFYNNILTFPELTYYEFLLAPHQKIYISAK
jgi:hypothetical protein